MPILRIEINFQGFHLYAKQACPMSDNHLERSPKPDCFLLIMATKFHLSSAKLGVHVDAPSCFSVRVEIERKYMIFLYLEKHLK